MTQPDPVQTTGREIVDLVKADLDERRRKGIATYGVALQAGNGRDTLRDLYEELLDAACYVRQLAAEQDAILRTLTEDERRQLAAHALNRAHYEEDWRYQTADPEESKRIRDRWLSISRALHPDPYKPCTPIPCPPWEGKMLSGVEACTCAPQEGWRLFTPGCPIHDPDAIRSSWRCSRCGSERWVAASLTGPVTEGGVAIKQCVPCGHYSGDRA